MIEVVNKIIRTSRKMLNEIGREPTPEELAEKLGMPVEKVRRVLKLAREPLSIETPVGDEEDVPVRIALATARACARYGVLVGSLTASLAGALILWMGH